MGLWYYRSRTCAAKAWQQWIDRALSGSLEPMKKVAWTVQHNLWGILNAVVLKASNGPAESMNAWIQRVKRQAWGYRSRERFRNAMFFHCGGLELYLERLKSQG
jgi:transposase